MVAKGKRCSTRLFTPASSTRECPEVETITGSMMQGQGYRLSIFASGPAKAGSGSILIFIAFGWMSLHTASTCRHTISAGTGKTASTTRVFCTVTALTAVAAYPPKADMVLMSACSPAPPPLSEPAILKMRTGCQNGWLEDEKLFIRQKKSFGKKKRKEKERKWTRGESNPYRQNRNLKFYPLNYGSLIWNAKVQKKIHLRDFR